MMQAFTTLRRCATWLPALLVSLLLAGCGGGGSEPVATGPMMVQLIGTAATGDPIAQRSVTVVNARGERASGLTSPGGGFAVNIAEGAPYLLSVTDPAGRTWYSYAASHGVANLTPLTTLALLDANGEKPLADLMAAWAQGALTPAQVLTAAAKVVAHFRNLLLANGLNPDRVNVFTHLFSANRQGLDAVLDGLDVQINCSAPGAVCTPTIRTTSGGGGVVLWNKQIGIAAVAIAWATATATATVNVTVNVSSSSSSSSSSTAAPAFGICKPAAVGTFSLVVQAVQPSQTVDTCIDGLTAKPATQAAFCVDPLVLQQLPAGSVVQRCDYDGTIGVIRVKVGSPAVDAVVGYGYVKR